jgi:nicotinamide-nucleotide amidase
MAGELYELAASVGAALSARGDTLTTAESCTGGGVGAAVTLVPGSSGWYERGYITYSNAAKTEELGVSGETLQVHGAVSEPVVLEMVDGALRRSGATLAVAVSGVAGPGGGTPAKPVGMVCIAWGRSDGLRRSATFCFDGDRDMVRGASVLAALDGVLEMAQAPMLS